MKHFINAGFGESIAGEFELFKKLGFVGVRQDIPTEKHLHLVDEFAGAGLTPIFLVGWDDTQDLVGLCQSISYRMYDKAVIGYIEIAAEYDLKKHPLYSGDPERWGALVQAAYLKVQPEPTSYLIAGGISNTSRKAIDWLARAAKGWPDDLIVGFHSYRNHPDEAKDGFRSRSEEFEALHAATGDRPLFCTESGYHTAKRKCLGIFTRQGLTDYQVANYLVQDFKIMARHGVRLHVLYQLNDGPDEFFMDDRYGIRKMDGTLKPQAYVIPTRST